MHVHFLLAYLLVNALLGIGLQIATLRSTLVRPKPMEMLVFSVIFLAAGSLLCLGAILYSGLKLLARR